MSFQSIILEKKEGVAKIVLNRPDRLNALNMETIEEIAAAVDDVDKDEGVRVVVITGAERPDKKRAFSVGADVRTIGFEVTAKPTDVLKISRRGHKLLNLLENMGKPVIAMVNGYCLGGGCELALACDFIIASEDAEFGQPEINLGIIPGWGATQRLPRRVGMSKALELILTGESIKAGEAERIGLADKVVTREKLEEAVMGLAKKIMAKSQVTVRIAKQTARRALDIDLETGLLHESQAFAVAFSTDDAKEGLTAFKERRTPQFRGK